MTLKLFFCFPLAIALGIFLITGQNCQRAKRDEKGEVYQFLTTVGGFCG